MASKLINKKQKEKYVKILCDLGEDKLYTIVIGAGIKASTREESPEIQILNESEAMLYLYRRTGKKEYFIISKLLRRAAHTVYRQLLSQNPNKKTNKKKFLNIV